MADFDPNTQPGNAGELHQQSGTGHPLLTTKQGVPISDDRNSLHAGARGPVLLEDFVLREKISHTAAFPGHCA